MSGNQTGACPGEMVISNTMLFFLSRNRGTLGYLTHYIDFNPPDVTDGKQQPGTIFMFANAFDVKLHLGETGTGTTGIRYADPSRAIFTSDKLKE
jgi:hypothetical protein